MKKIIAVLSALSVLFSSTSFAQDLSAMTDDPDIFLYYQPDGGEYYHLDQNCKRVHPKYLPLQDSFLYSELNDEAYRDLDFLNTMSCRDDGICLSHYHEVLWETNVSEEAVKNTIAGNIRTYREMTDGTWTCEGYTYQYRLEIKGRMPNAAADSTFVYLSNIEEISFEQAYMAAGLSSNMDDYYSPGEAVLVDMN